MLQKLVAFEVLLFCRNRFVPMIVGVEESDKSDEPLTPVNFSSPLLIFATSTPTLCFIWWLGGGFLLVYFIEIRQNWGSLQLAWGAFLA